MISENSRLRFPRLHSTVHRVSHETVFLREEESCSQYLMRLQPDQEVDAIMLDVSDAFKKTCDLCQPTFVGLCFVSEPAI
jgi:hypothetical protein